MDLKGYYRKIREVEASLSDESVVVRSLATAAGGRDGQLTEVRRETAARMIVDGSAEALTADEAKAYRAQVKEAYEREVERRQASQVSFTVISEADLQALGKASRGRKE